MKTRKLVNVITVILWLMLFTFVNTICYAEEKPITFKGVWSAGGIGGSWFSLAVTSAEVIKNAQLPNVEISFKVVPGGGIANPMKIVNGEVGLAYGISPGLVIFTKKEGPYNGKEYDISPLRVVAESFNNNELNLYAAEETGIKTMSDFVQLIKEKKPVRLAVGGYNMTDIFLFEEILKFYGLKLEDIQAAGGKILMGGYTEGCNNISDKNADYWFAFEAVDNASVLQASISRKLVLVEYPDDLIEYLHKKVGLNRKILKGNTNPNIETEGKVSVDAATILIASINVPEEVIYNITKALCENYEELHVYEVSKCFVPETAGANVCNIPLHPGAERYYKEKGYSYNPGK